MPFDIQRGINLGGWLGSIARDTRPRRAADVTDADLAKLAAIGCDHVRLPVDEQIMYDESGVRQAEAWDRMEGCLDACARHGLRAIVDLHILRCHFFNAPERPLFTDPEAPKHFADVWRDLAAGLASRSNDRVAYELLNEPVADDPEDWNRVYPYALAAVRETEPERTVVLGSNAWNQAVTFEDLAIPAGDPNLILTFHEYNSMIITHYRAEFVPDCAAYDGPIQYPGRPVPAEAWEGLAPDLKARLAKWNEPCGPESMAARIQAPLAARERTGLPLYCGEFGVIHHAPPEIRDAWHRDFVSVLDAHRVAWAPWNYRGRFGPFTADGTPTPAARAMYRGSGT